MLDLCLQGVRVTKQPGIMLPIWAFLEALMPGEGGWRAPAPQAGEGVIDDVMTCV